MTTFTVSSGVTSSGITVGNGDTWIIDGTALSFTVLSGGIEAVSAGGSAVSTTVSSGGRENVYPGGSDIGTTVSSRGREYVYSSGTTSFTVLSGGFEAVFGGGSTVSTTVSRGTEYVYSGGTASSTIVSSGGIERVYGDATASSTEVSDGGYEYLDGGSAVSTTVSNGGSQVVSSGGTANDTVVRSGGIEVVSGDGYTASTTVDSGGFEIVFGEALSTTADSGGYLVVLPGSVLISPNVLPGGEIVSTGVVVLRPDSGVAILGSSASNVTLGYGASEYILSGGSAVSTMVRRSSTEVVYSGGSASDTTVSSGGQEMVSAGGTATSTTVTVSGQQIVASGGTASFTTVRHGGTDLVLSGGATVSAVIIGSQNVMGGATSFTVLNGGVEAVSSGGSAVSTTVSSGGRESVYRGGTASSTIVSSGGSEIVSSGGSASETTVSSGGTEIVFSGGTAISTTVNYGGTEILHSVGTAISTTLSGGTEIVSGGGTARATTVSSGGVVEVTGLGATSSTTIYSGGFEIVSDGATARFTTISSGGVADISLNGFAISTTVSNGGIESVTYEGRTSSTTVDSGGFQVVAGDAFATTVRSGGSEILASGGAGYATIDSGGYEVVDSGAFEENTTVSSGGYVVVLPGGVFTQPHLTDGEIVVISSEVWLVPPNARAIQYGSSASGVSVSSGAIECVLSGGAASFTTVSDGGQEIVSAGGTTTSTTVKGGGQEIVASDGTASFTTVSQGGADRVRSGGATVSATVSNGGFEYVLSAGSARFTTVKSNGSLAVDPHGTAIHTTVSSGGIETVYQDGTASATVVNSGGVETVIGRGTASSTVVGNGGAQFVYSSGEALSTTVDSGGYLIVLPNGLSISPNVLPGGEIVSTGVVVYQPGSGVAVLGSTASDVALGSGAFEYILPGGNAVSTTVSLGGSIDVTYLPYLIGGTASVNTTTDVLTVSVGHQSYTQQLAGDYTNEYFHISIGPGGGTQVTLEGTPCYCRGTRILTDHGEVAVEDLRIGDRLKTLSGRARKLRWIGRRSYAGRFAAANPDILPVLIRRGALADGTPRRDLYVSPLHAMYLDDVLIPAVLLVNGASIQQVAAIEQVEYFHLELATHDIILAEGAASETFVDDDSRGMFHNAAEYRLLYPNAPRVPARYCAPRVQDCDVLGAVLRRLADRAQLRQHDAGAAPGQLLGCLEYVGPDRATGWARDPAAPDRPVWLRILDNGSAVGLIAADQHRETLWRTGLGDGRCGFEIVFPGGLSPLTRHVIRVERASDGMELPTSPWSVGGASMGGAAMGGARGAPTEPAAPIGALRGQLDAAMRDRIAGWARDAAFPDTPVALQVLDNNVPIARVLANHVRTDLAEAGLGAGRHGFEIVVPGGLSPLARHVIRVRREADGAELPGSPAVIEAAGSFDAGLQQAIARAVAAIGPDDDQDHVLSFILGQADRLLQQRADAESRRTQRLAHRRAARRWGTPAPGLATPGLAPPADPGLRALVIDHRVPVAGRDAGSQALLSHMGALRRLGYAVSFVAADEMSPDEADVAALTALGVAGCVAPFYASAEDVLRRQADCFDVVYLHRVGVATRYLGLARHYMPRARVLYSVADLHHVRLERQAVVEQRPELLAVSRRMRLEECTAAWAADAVITHSAEEAELLRRAVPEASVYRVPWQVAAGGVRAAGTAADGRVAVGRAADGHATVQRVAVGRAAVGHAPGGGVAVGRVAIGHAPGGGVAVGRAAIGHVPDGRVPVGGAALAPATIGHAVVGHAPGGGAVVRPAAIAPFAARRGLVFVGSYTHAPNVDAACWLVETVMPLVWQVDRDIVCLLVGSAMPDVVRRLARPGVVPLGEVADLGSVFARVRLSVAPLRYGAGVKGKVLDSLAAGVPCVMTPIAAEGLGLPAGLRGLVSEDAARFARLICRLHRSEAAHGKAVRAGQSLIRKNHNEAVVIAALQAAVEGRGMAVGSMKAGGPTNPAVPADHRRVENVARPRRIA